MFSCRYIHEVTEKLEENLCPAFVKFPITRAEINEKKESFMNKYNFPGIIGTIDGTHVAILKPKNDEHNFIIERGFILLMFRLFVIAI